MLEKLTSRKLVVTLVTLGCILIGQFSGFDGEQAAVTLAPLIYVLVEGIRDIVIASQPATTPATTPPKKKITTP